MSRIIAVTGAGRRNRPSATEKASPGGTSGAFAAKPHLSANSRSRKQMSTGESYEQRNPPKTS